MMATQICHEHHSFWSMENLWIRSGETPAGPGPVPWPSSNSEAVLEPEPHLSSGKNMKNAPKSIKGHTKMPILAQLQIC